jgi:hypothetical protein
MRAAPVLSTTAITDPSACSFASAMRAALRAVARTEPDNRAKASGVSVSRN